MAGVETEGTPCWHQVVRRGAFGVRDWHERGDEIRGSVAALALLENVARVSFQASWGALREETYERELRRGAGRLLAMQDNECHPDVPQLH